MSTSYTRTGRKRRRKGGEDEEGDEAEDEKDEEEKEKEKEEDARVLTLGSWFGHLQKLLPTCHYFRHTTTNNKETLDQNIYPLKSQSNACTLTTIEKAV